MNRRALLIGMTALTACSPAPPSPLRFAAGEDGLTQPPCGLSSIDWPMLDTLRAEYGLENVVRGAATDLDRVRRISAWTRSRWRHNGSNQPSKNDPLTILSEAAGGRRFRCVEYSEVLAGALSSLGVPARVLGLQRVDIETARSGAGHVAAEAWLADQGRWVLVDGQWDVIPFSAGKPLNAVELAAALANDDPGLTLESFSGASTGRFARWIRPYLFYFVAHPRRWTTGAPSNFRDVMLAPDAAPFPKVFQRRFAQSDYVGVRSTATFYAPPPMCSRPAAAA
jgi:hypothetical protein